MPLTVDFIRPGCAFVNGEEPLASPHLVVRDDRRSVMGRDINDNLVVLSLDGPMATTLREQNATLDFSRMVDLKTNVQSIVDKVDSSKPLTVFQVNVDGLDCAYLFAESDTSSASSFKAFTAHDVGLKDALSAVSAYNASRFPSDAAENQDDFDAINSRGLDR